MYLFMNILFLLIILIFFMMYKFNHSFLMILISMEFLVMTNLVLLMMNDLLFNEWMFLFYMVFSVCESVIGLVILINMIYFNGNQSITFTNLEW